ncbi:SRPBCC family protein [Chitinophaga rhizosphaerae]|uniref:SRPBCC family protein n=1 Tax=Chitinophaga rhizosphaerae TaxID=1864947 RepID=UPI00196A38AF|nr:SRPBCC domain-containing protein [Chitinophaga rhizosphaerae]
MKTESLIKPEPLIVERTYPATPQKVWDAITDPDKMRVWYFDTKGFKVEKGTEFSFDCFCDETLFRHLCVVTEVVPQRKIAYTWRYEGFPGNSEVTWELFPENGGTRLKLTHTGLESFPQDHPSFVRSSFMGGWGDFLDRALPEFLQQAA